MIKQMFMALFLSLNIYSIYSESFNQRIWTVHRTNFDIKGNAPMTKMSDGTYVAVSSVLFNPTQAFHTVNLTRLNQDGTLKLIYSLFANTDQRVYSVIETADPDYVILVGGRRSGVGGVNFQGFVMKVDLKQPHNIEWQFEFGRLDRQDQFNSIIQFNDPQTGNDNYLIVGNSSGSSDNAIFAIRINGAGDILWSNYYTQDVGTPTEHFTHAILNDDGEVIVTGMDGTIIGSSGDELFVMGIDPVSGDITQRFRKYRHTLNTNIFYTNPKITQTQEGGYALTFTHIESDPVDGDLHHTGVLKLNDDFSVDWHKAYFSNVDIKEGVQAKGERGLSITSRDNTHPELGAGLDVLVDTGAPSSSPPSRQARLLRLDPVGGVQSFLRLNENHPHIPHLTGHTAKSMVNIQNELLILTQTSWQAGFTGPLVGFGLISIVPGEDPGCIGEIPLENVTEVQTVESLEPHFVFPEFFALKTTTTNYLVPRVYIEADCETVPTFNFQTW